MAMLLLAWKSLLNRRYTALLTLFSIALSCALLLSVQRLRVETHDAFTQSVSGTDLVVGARSGSINLLLYSVFHIGNATNNISWKSYLDIASANQVAWSIPISLGDSHRGYRVVGSNEDLFRHFRYGDKRPLQFAAGVPFAAPYDVVLGAEVARALGYTLGARLVLEHGAGNVSLVRHEDRPFVVTGILERTGTPVDRSLLVSLQGIDAIHVGWQGGAPLPGMQISPEAAARLARTPHTITAFFVGLKSKVATFAMQRQINEYAEEPMSAVLPGVALQELWGVMAFAEQALTAMSVMVVLVGLVGMMGVMLSGLNERRREMAILRAMGAGPRQILLLVSGESLVLTMLGVTLGVGMLYLFLLTLQPLVQARLGFYLPIDVPTQQEWAMMGLLILAGLLLGIVPALRAYRFSLMDGMRIRS